MPPLIISCSCMVILCNHVAISVASCHCCMRRGAQRFLLPRHGRPPRSHDWCNCGVGHLLRMVFYSPGMIIWFALRVARSRRWRGSSQVVRDVRRSGIGVPFAASLWKPSVLLLDARVPARLTVQPSAIGGPVALCLEVSDCFGGPVAVSSGGVLLLVSLQWGLRRSVVGGSGVVFEVCRSVTEGPAQVRWCRWRSSRSVF